MTEVATFHLQMIVAHKGDFLRTEASIINAPLLLNRGNLPSSIPTSEKPNRSIRFNSHYLNENGHIVYPLKWHSI